MSFLRVEKGWGKKEVYYGKISKEINECIFFERAIIVYMSVIKNSIL